MLYSFANTPDGAYPIGGLVQLGGFLYGTTYNGGKFRRGTVYRLSITGKETVLHSFTGSYGGPDGAAPNGELLARNGQLYGTTAYGGRHGCGVVFTVTKAGDVQNLHTFSGNPDGSTPMAGLVAVDRTFYGTTSAGGNNDEGTVFAIDLASGKERIVYRFGGPNDGTDPSSTLRFWNNNLYGTTRTGGALGQGTVFSLNVSGKETVVYSLPGGNDGADPHYSTVTPLNGALYGTTVGGGLRGSGVVFEISPSGVGRTLYSFGVNPADGNQEASGVIAYRNELYGTSSGGGTHGAGAIFRITAAGRETVLSELSGNEYGGFIPRLVSDGSNLYGAIPFEGKDGAGMVFRVAP